MSAMRAVTAGAVLALTVGLGACAPGSAALGSQPDGATIPPGSSLSVPVPAGSGVGKRVVWAKKANHVWLVGADGQLVRDYAVTDLDWKTPPGTYRVMRKSRRAYASDSQNGAQTLNWFVPFYRRCSSCSLIGFHAIPVTQSGRQVQPVSALGSEQYHSHGCIRQAPDDARTLYNFVSPGTRVVVVK